MLYLDKPESLGQRQVLLRGELEPHLGILLLPQRRPGKVLLHKGNNLSLNMVRQGSRTVSRGVDAHTLHICSTRGRRAGYPSLPPSNGKKVLAQHYYSNARLLVAQGINVTDSHPERG